MAVGDAKGKSGSAGGTTAPKPGRIKGAMSALNESGAVGVMRSFGSGGVAVANSFKKLSPSQRNRIMRSVRAQPSRIEAIRTLRSSTAKARIAALKN